MDDESRAASAFEGGMHCGGAVWVTRAHSPLERQIQVRQIQVADNTASSNVRTDVAYGVVALYVSTNPYDLRPESAQYPIRR